MNLTWTKTQEFHSEGGLIEFVTFLDESRTPLLDRPIYAVGKEDNVEVEVALQYNTGYQENIFSLCKQYQYQRRRGRMCSRF